MYIVGLGTATPPQRYTQAQCWAAIQGSRQFSQLSRRSRSILERVLNGVNGIATRSLALEALEDAFDLTPDALHQRYARHAPALAAQAAERALRTTGSAPQAMDAIIVSTCTGYLCPGLSSYVIERLGMRPDIVALDLVGHGCGAALPNWSAAQGLLAGGRCERVLSICVEVCSAAFYLDNDPGVLISACLFSDGAGAVVLARAPHAHFRTIEWKAYNSVTSPQDRDLLRFEQKNGMLRNILTRPVPALAARHVEIILDKTLGENGLVRSDINAWIWHAGGRDVLIALQEKLGLTDTDIRWSGAALREFGNLSSAFVYFVLEAALSGGAPGGFWWLSSFGAGFSCHGALLEVGAAS